MVAVAIDKDVVVFVGAVDVLVGLAGSLVVIGNGHESRRARGGSRGAICSSPIPIQIDGLVAHVPRVVKVVSLTYSLQSLAVFIQTCCSICCFLCLAGRQVESLLNGCDQECSLFAACLHLSGNPDICHPVSICGR